MPSTVELSLSELAKIALGAPEMGTVNFAVLHCLIDMILRKLDCQEEKVTISGLEAKCVQQILDKTKLLPATLAFNDEHMEPVSVQLHKIAVLEQKIDDMQMKLNEHFEQIRACNKFNNEQLDAKFWQIYATPCEDLCTTCDEGNNIACSLLQNVGFMKKLMRIIALPIVDCMTDIDNKLESFYQRLQTLIDNTNLLYERLELLKQCVIEIENLRDLVGQHNSLFLGTMEELQDMLDSKLDKVHMPALKKYIRDRFSEVEARLNMIETKATCPRAAGFINTGIACLSCGNSNVGVDVTPQTMQLMPDAKPQAQLQPQPHKLNKKKSCRQLAICRTVEKEPTIMLRMQNLDLDILEQRLQRPNDDKVCKLPEANDTIYGLRYSNATV